MLVSARCADRLFAVD